MPRNMRHRRPYRALAHALLAPHQQAAVGGEEGAHRREHPRVLPARHEQHVDVEEDRGDEEALDAGALLFDAVALVEFLKVWVAECAPEEAPRVHFAQHEGIFVIRRHFYEFFG